MSNRFDCLIHFSIISSSFSVTALNAQRSYKASATSMTRPAHYPATSNRF
ncbi:hypothetical protein HID58_006819, partial [Brassica napus]